MRVVHDHSPAAIRQRLLAGPKASYLRDWIYGGIDGAVTTFAVVSSVVGAGLSARVIVILGAANLIADGFSMAASNYTGTRAEHDEYEYLRAAEREHIATDPAGEREEIRQIYENKGFTGDDLERVVDTVTADRERWVEAMLRDEYGLASTTRSPVRAAAATFSAFLLCGLAPLLPYLLGLASAFEISTAATGIVFFLVGCVRSRWSPYPWWKTGLGTFVAGGLAASLAFLAGRLLRGLV